MDFKTHLSTFLTSDEADSLLKALQQDPVNGVRFNSTKITTSDLLSQFKTLTKHPLVENGYYYERTIERLSTHPWHHGGAYYLQEPAAMLVGELLPIQQTPMMVVDLAASPGGKSIHVGSRLPSGSVLISHEIEYSRAQILADNITRWGLANTIVTTGDPHLLASSLTGSVDAVILDAPCSGEGMFRKNDFAVEDWSMGKVDNCSLLQRDLLNLALKLVKPNGYIIYSTCTFNPIENEQVVATALATESVCMIPLLTHPSIARGITNESAIRLYPHRYHGEGHFIALMQKLTGPVERYKPFSITPISKKQLSYIHQIMKVNDADMNYHFFQNQVYLLPTISPALPRLGILQSGLSLGEFKGDDFIPSHASACAFPSVIDAVTYSLTIEQVNIYLRGESFPVVANDGWVILTYHGVAMGWGKVIRGQLKNKLPKFSRKTK